MSSLMFATLESHKTLSIKKGLALGKGELPIVFTTEAGSYIRVDSWW